MRKQMIGTVELILHCSIIEKSLHKKPWSAAKNFAGEIKRISECNQLYQRREGIA
jgi:hypothetical protein